MKKTKSSVRFIGNGKKLLTVLLAVLTLLNVLIVAVPGRSGIVAYAEENVEVVEESAEDAAAEPAEKTVSDSEAEPADNSAEEPAAEPGRVIDAAGTGLPFGQLEYVINADGIGILRCDVNAAGVVEIPGMIDGMPVVSICDHAFNGCSNVTQVILPETITRIGNCAFVGCEQLSAINIPESVSVIGVDAFMGCPVISVTNNDSEEKSCVVGGDSPVIGGVPNVEESIPEISYNEELDAWVYTEYVGLDKYNATVIPDETIDYIFGELMKFNEMIDVSDYNLYLSDMKGFESALVAAYPIEYSAAAVSYFSYWHYSDGSVCDIQVYYEVENAAETYPERYDALKYNLGLIFEQIDNKNTYEKLLYVHDYLVYNSKYDETYSLYSAYDILVNGTGVCQAYTEAYELVLMLCDIPCARSTSEAMNHIWNLVQVDGKWYHVDVTWDDPLPDRGSGWTRYEHFLLNDAEMEAAEHYGWVDDYTCNSTRFSDAPRGDSYDQVYYNGKWYSYSGNYYEYSLSVTDIYGNDCGSYSFPDAECAVFYNGVVFYGKGNQIYSKNLTTGKVMLEYTLSASEQAKSDPSDPAEISSISIASNGKMTYTYFVWNEDGYSILDGNNSIDVSKSANMIAATSIALNKSEMQLPKGRYDVLTATLAPSGSTSEVTWKSSDTNIVDVVGGLVTAKKFGIVTITATAGGVSTTCKVTVPNPATAISLDKSKIVLAPGKSSTLTASVKPVDTTDVVIWKSSNTSVATVSNGKVSAVGKGTATITATAGKFSDTCTVVVAEAPVMTEAFNSATGVRVSWKPVSGAVKYRLLRRAASGGAWTTVGETSECSVIDTTAKSGFRYTYTVECIDSSGKSTSPCSDPGRTCTYIAMANITSVTSGSNGITIKWDKPAGAKNFRVMRKVDGSSSWKVLADVLGDSYLDTSVQSGVKYRYTVRAITLAGDMYINSYNSIGWSGQWAAVPVLTEAFNSATGVRVSWKPVDGAEKYRLLRKSSSDVDWVNVGETTENTLIDKTAKSGYRYTYTVECINSSGKAVGGRDEVGRTCTYIAMAKITALSSTSKGVSITWSKPAGASNFRVMRKTEGGSWKILGDVKGTSYVDTTAQSGVRYWYTVRAITLAGDMYINSYNASGWSVTAK